MSQRMTAHPGNKLLDRLPTEELRDLLHSCERVQLRAGEVLYEPGRPIHHVFFPLTCVVFLLAAAHRGGGPLAVNLVGCEGMIGAPLGLGVDENPTRALVRSAGVALRVSAAEFRAALRRSVALRRLLSRYVYVRLSDLAQEVWCAHFHRIESRLARWLLMAQDGARSDVFRFKHQVLAETLGVRRSGISVAAAELKAQGIITYSRGSITLLDRAGLEERACSCYRHSLNTYERILGGPLEGSSTAVPPPPARELELGAPSNRPESLIA